MFRKIIILSTLFLLLFAGSCHRSTRDPIILVSREYGNVFMNWLSRADNTITRINMYTVGADSIEHFLSLADGVIISGGPDINPDIYGKVQEASRCGPIDHRRDTLELRMILEADSPFSLSIAISFMEAVHAGQTKKTRALRKEPGF